MANTVKVLVKTKKTGTTTYTNLLMLLSKQLTHAVNAVIINENKMTV